MNLRVTIVDICNDFAPAANRRGFTSAAIEFKEAAVALVRDQGYSVPEVAKQLGIATNILYRWKQKIEDQEQGKVLSVD